MVERFNGRIEAIIEQTRFSSKDDLKTILTSYCKIYNNKIPQKNMGHIPSVTALKNWQKTKPDILKKSVYNFTGSDIYACKTEVTSQGKQAAENGTLNIK